MTMQKETPPGTAEFQLPPNFELCLDFTMKRIFLTLAVLANVTMLASLLMGLQIGDPMTLGGRDPDVNRRIGNHILIGLFALTSVTMVHALLFTYFMGTGRWIEETSAAYSLSPQLYKASQKLKYGILPGIIFTFLMALATGCCGAIADPATAVSLTGYTGFSDSLLHFFMAIATWCVNLLVNFTQYFRIAGNSAIVEAVLNEVRRIRLERGLPVDEMS